MSYHQAKKCFDDVHDYVSPNPRAPVESALFNLAEGLAELAAAIESDLNKLHRGIQTVKRQTD